MRVLYVMQIVGGFIMVVGYIPQLHQMFKTKSVHDLNLRTFLLLCLGLSLMEAYAIGLVVVEGTGDAFLITNTFGLALNILVASLIIFYRRREKAASESAALLEDPWEMD